MTPARGYIGIVLLTSLLAGCTSNTAGLDDIPASPYADEWRTYNHTPDGARHSPLRAITPDNVQQLRVAWTYHMRPSSDDGRPLRFATSQATPLMIDDTLYLPTSYGEVVALDADTGEQRWAYHLPGHDQPSLRGVAYWPGTSDAAPSIIFGTRSGKLISLSAATGRPNPGFGRQGIIDMKTPQVMNQHPHAPLGMSSPPLVYQDLVFTGSRVQEMPARGAAGDVRAWNARTGELVWTFHAVPRPGEPGHDTWHGDSGHQRSGVNAWTPMVLDEARDMLYIPFAAPAFDRWGGDRPGANLFGNAIVAVRASTGDYLWHFQTVHHDIWDLDLPVATLLHIRRNGERIPAIAVMNKSALLFLLDRRTGAPLHEVREVPVPTDTDIADEQPWPTQPMPVKPPPLAGLSLELANLARLTPQHTAACRRLIDQLAIASSRPFQPLRADSAVASMPGSLGGVNWGGGSFDPALGYFIINTNELASPQQLAQRADGSWTPKGGYHYFWDRQTRLPCQAPPWGQLQAVDVNSGEIAWRTTLGISEQLPAHQQHTGRPSAGGPITTASGLTFIGGTDDRRLRAFDTRTGAELWAYRLDASIYATPMTYHTGTGRQLVVVVATGGFAGSPPDSDAVIAFGLP